MPRIALVHLVRAVACSPPVFLTGDRSLRVGGDIRESAGLPRIKLHDVRHSYATAGRDARIDWKALSRRIGHADVAFTMKQYVHTDLEADRQVASTLAELILGGSLASVEIGPEAVSYGPEAAV